MHRVFISSYTVASLTYYLIMFDETIERNIVAVSINKKSQQRHIGAAVIERLKRKNERDDILYSINLFQFIEENDHFSTLDSFLMQLGSCTMYMSDEFENTTKGDGRKIANILHGKDVDIVHVKKTCFQRKQDLAGKILKLTGRTSHVSNIAETERPLAYSCIECLIATQRLLEDEALIGKYDLTFGSLASYMRLDSAAAEAVNLLPKADHPSQFGSIFGGKVLISQ